MYVTSINFLTLARAKGGVELAEAPLAAKSLREEHGDV